MRTFTLMAMVATILAAGGVHAADPDAPGKNWNPQQKTDHPSNRGSISGKNWSPRDHADHPSHWTRKHPSDKEWTPPPGRLPDHILANLTWDSDRHHREQQPVRLSQIGEAPEPGTLLLTGIGLAALVASRRRKRFPGSPLDR